MGAPTDMCCKRLQRGRRRGKRRIQLLGSPLFSSPPAGCFRGANILRKRACKLQPLHVGTGSLTAHSRVGPGASPDGFCLPQRRSCLPPPSVSPLTQFSLAPATVSETLGSGETESLLSNGHIVAGLFLFPLSPPTFLNGRTIRCWGFHVPREKVVSLATAPPPPIFSLSFLPSK